MKGYLLFAFLPVIVAVQASHDVSPLEVYWRSILPNTTMPDAIHDLIYPVLKDNDVSKTKVKVRKDMTQHIFILSGTKNRVKVREGMERHVFILSGAKNRIKKHEGVKQHIFILSGRLPSPDYIRSTFFPKKDMYPGAQMNEGTNFDRTIIGSTFVPRTEADRIPFSSKNLPQILDHFSMIPGTKDAKQIEQILKDCEEPTLMGEKKFCATSLESMIDNVVNILGTTDARVISTTINRNEKIARYGKTAYKIASPIKKIPYHSKLVICHQEPSPQAVHYCHTNIAYEAFIVPLVGNDGSIVHAATICHHDTSNFNSDFLRVLNVEPGTEPICHFLPENHFIWVSSHAMSQAEDNYVDRAV